MPNIYQKAEENGIMLECTCSSITETEWNKLYKGSRKANGKKIRMLIKKHLPELYEALSLNLNNPFEEQSVRTETHLIYIWSATDYFLKIC